MPLHQKFTSLFLIGFVFFISACNTSQSAMNKKAIKQMQSKLPTTLLKGIEAHGGLAQWQNMETWEFSVTRNDKREQHYIDLKSRKVLLSHDDYKLGFDGKEVWVSPNKAAFGKGSPRFYHNLYFYFHAFPFIATDPGINYEVLAQKELNGKLYDAVKITFNAGVGDAPDDAYILHFDPDTHRMHLLLYTVTYFNGKPGNKFNAIIYDEWQKVNGLLVPKNMKGYKYENGKLGEQRYDRQFIDIKLGQTPANQSKFEMPANAEIDALISHEAAATK